MVSFNDENAAAAGATTAAAPAVSDDDTTLDNESMEGILRWFEDDTVELVADDFPFCFANRF